MIVDRVPESARELIERVRALPYGRPSERSVVAMLAERKGTCSLKHRYLAEALERDHSMLEPRIVHRVYLVSHRDAMRAHGPSVAGLVPAGGLVDVHRYLTIALGGRRIAVDATFAGALWDARSPMPLACGPGDDEECLGEPDERKRQLEREHCNPAVREPFIAALANAYGAPPPTSTRQHGRAQPRVSSVESSRSVDPRDADAEMSGLSQATGPRDGGAGTGSRSGCRSGSSQRSRPAARRSGE